MEEKREKQSKLKIDRSACYLNNDNSFAIVSYELM